MSPRQEDAIVDRLRQHGVTAQCVALAYSGLRPGIGRPILFSTGIPLTRVWILAMVGGRIVQFQTTQALGLKYPLTSEEVLEVVPLRRGRVYNTYRVDGTKFWVETRYQDVMQSFAELS